MDFSFSSTSAGTSSRVAYDGLAAATCIAISFTSGANSTRALTCGVTPENSTMTAILPPRWMYCPT